MKKLFVPLFSILTITANPQISPAKFSIHHPDGFQYITMKTEKGLKAGYKNNISADILRHFSKLFDTTVDAEWLIDDEEVTASLKNENVMVRYKKNGCYVSTRKVYDGTKLDENILSFLSENVNADLVPNLVTELSSAENTAYEISMS